MNKAVECISIIHQMKGLDFVFHAIFFVLLLIQQKLVVVAWCVLSCFCRLSSELVSLSRMCKMYHFTPTPTHQDGRFSLGRHCHMNFETLNNKLTLVTPIRQFCALSPSC